MLNLREPVGGALLVASTAMLLVWPQWREKQLPSWTQMHGWSTAFDRHVHWVQYNQAIAKCHWNNELAYGNFGVICQGDVYGFRSDCEHIFQTNVSTCTVIENGLERIITRVGPLVLPAGSFVDFTLEPAGSRKENVFLTEFLNWSRNTSTGHLTRYPPIWPHHSVGFASGQQHERSTNLIGYTPLFHDIPFGLEDYVCDIFAFSYECVYQVLPHGLGLPQTTVRNNAVLVNVDSIDHPLILEFGRTYRMSRPREEIRAVHFWTVNVAGNSMSPTLLIPKNGGESMAFRTFYMPAKGRFYSCINAHHSHPQVPNSMWILNVPFDRVIPTSMLPPEVAGSRIHYGNGMMSRPAPTSAPVLLEPLGESVSRITSMIMRIHGSTVLCRFKSHTESVHGHVVTRGGLYHASCQERCSGYSFFKNDTITMITFSEAAAETFINHEHFEPLVAFET